MQSRRRFFCARVELVQLARAFLCPSAGHAGTMDRAQEPQPRDGGAQVDTAAPGASCTIYPRPQPPQRAHRATQPGKGTGTTGKPRNRPQSRPQRAHRRKQSTAPGTIPPETPTNAPQSRPGRGCYPYTTRRQNAPTAAHRAAHRGQAAGGTETPGRTSPQPPQPRHSTPGENPGGFL